MAAQRQPRRLDVDHRESRQHGVFRAGPLHLGLHERQPRPWVSHCDPNGQSSSAARLATSLRSQAVRVTWPKQGWSVKALVSTARALFDSPRYGASIWLVSPVNTTFVPSPTRVRIVR